MTCRDRLKLEHPENINSCYTGGCNGCPHDYGYLAKPCWCKFRAYTCTRCWDREIPGTEEDYDISTLMNKMLDVAIKETNRHVTVKLDSHGITVNFYPVNEKEN